MKNIKDYDLQDLKDELVSKPFIRIKRKTKTKLYNLQLQYIKKIRII